MTNAAIAFVQEFGSPAQNIPARPFLVPGVQHAERAVLPHLKAAIEGALDSKPSRVNAELHACGELAVASVRKQISSNIPPPLSPATIRNRQYSRGTASARSAETAYGKLIAEGVPPAAAQTATGIRSLINSGQLLRSVDYVIRDDKHHPHHSHSGGLPGKDSANRSLSDGGRPGTGMAGSAAGEIVGTVEGFAGEAEGAVAGAIEGIGAIIP